VKNLLKLAISISFIIIVGCSDGGNSSDANPVGIGTDGVTFSIGSINRQEDVDGDGNLDDVLYFTASPSVTVKITKVTFNLPSQNYTDSFSDDGITEYTANTPVEVVGFFKSEITSGQQWTFQFEGTTSSDNKTFNVTSNYKVP
jgi:hypothetical protein